LLFHDHGAAGPLRSKARVELELQLTEAVSVDEMGGGGGGGGEEETVTDMGAVEVGEDDAARDVEVVVLALGGGLVRGRAPDKTANDRNCCNVVS
jgi:hypothetical protein